MLEFKRDGVTVCTDEPELDDVSRLRAEELGDPTGTSNELPLVILLLVGASAVGVTAGLTFLYPESRTTSPSPTTPSELEAIACSTSGSQKMPPFSTSPSLILPDGVGGPESMREEDAVWYIDIAVVVIVPFAYREREVAREFPSCTLEFRSLLALGIGDGIVG